MFIKSPPYSLVERDHGDGHKQITISAATRAAAQQGVDDLLVRVEVRGGFAEISFPRPTQDGTWIAAGYASYGAAADAVLA
ncbi:MAG: hypothetical protein AB7K64_22870 [Variibacter sp.]